MKVSIITVNLNDKEGLKRTIQSVICQSFIDYEIIVIDGQSLDGSLGVIKQYENNITYWVSEKDTGIYNAMNKGIAQAKGDYCYFLNAGDVLADTDVLQSVFAGNPSESFICGNFTSEYKGETQFHTPYKDKDWTFSLYDIYSGDLCHQAFFIRKDMFEKYEYYKESLRITADWRLFFIAIGINNESVCYRDVNMVIYNMEGLSSTIGGTVIYAERRETALEVLKPETADRLHDLYSLEQDRYIIDNVKGNKILFFFFRIYCKIARTLGFIK